ncbi:MAG: 16S rRNA (guanine(527)-N(7))-methyltransferase RsmG [Candidatus Firestonebacteria bacterium]
MLSKQELNLLVNGAKELNITLSDTQIQQFDIYLDELQKWNASINLTGLKTKDDIIIKHFIDSLSCGQVLEEYYPQDISNLWIIDIGSGAGFPGIPIKICYNIKKLVLLDSSKKKISFLKFITNKLNLPNVMFLYGRAEDYMQNSDCKSKFDVVFARAFAKLKLSIEIALPFVKKDGLLVFQKGINVFDEIEGEENNIEEFGGKITEVKKIKIPFLDQIRHLVVIKKIK